MECFYSVFNNSYNPNVVKQKLNFLFLPPIGDIATSTYYKISIPRGLYKFEAWGSVGSQYYEAGNPGNGAYACGSIFLSEQENKLFLYIGSRNGFNAAEEGQTSGCYGGGASDVRFVDGKWSDFESLKSRIFVAAGGGAAEWRASIGGHGGDLTGGTGYGAYSHSSQSIDNNIYAFGGSQNQTTQGEYFVNISASLRAVTPGRFGMAIRKESSSDLGPSGGGGYYGGFSVDYSGGAGGGSSFISGHKGCLAINENSTNFEDISHLNHSHHYSGYRFFDTLLIPGNSNMPSFSSKTFPEGNSLEGAIRITLLSYKETCQTRRHLHISFLFYILYIKF